MEIQEIKQKLSILRVLQHYQLTTDKNNRLNCPFHKDKTPSLQVYPETNTWTCFSSNCKAGSGDQIDFIMKYEKITKHEALLKAKELIMNYELLIMNEKENQKSKIVNLQSLSKNELTQEQRIQTLTEAFTHFVMGLKSKPEKAIKYIESRRLDYKKLAVGYDAGTLHKTKDITAEQKQIYLQTGLLKPDKFGRENSYYTRFNGCIVFPMLDRAGNIVSLYGRHTEKEEHHYLEGDHKGLYPCYPEADTTKLILTESIIDTATLLVNSEKLKVNSKNQAILALYGTNGFTEEHWTAITELKKLKEIILFFDGDESGRSAIKKHYETFKQLRPTVKISYVNTPDNEDINSMYVNYDEEAIQKLIEERIFLFSNEKTIENKHTQTIETTDNTEQNPKSLIPNPKLKISNSDCLQYETEHLKITLWGGIELHQVNRLRATLHIQLKSNIYAEFRDTADLYSHSQTERLIRQTSEKLEISTGIVGRTITELTKQLENYREQKREEKRKQEQEQQQQNRDIFTKEQMQQAGQFLSSAELTRKTYNLFNKLGLVGQQKNGLLLFFIFLTRLFKNPLHAIVMGSSGTGKTYLLQNVANTVPKQHIHVTTSLSENTLYYTPKNFLQHKILLQEDLDGAYNALLPLRELMSNQSISRFSTKTNSRTGDSKQVYLHVEGPVCVAGATTKERIYEDNANRSFLIQIEEHPTYEKDILDYQGQVAAGLTNITEYENTVNLLKTCQLLLQPYEVIIPFATKLQLPQTVFKKLRTKMHYLTLIKSITLWNQRKRSTTTDKEGNKYLISTIEDVEWANYLSKESLLRKSDELNGKTRQFFESLKEQLTIKDEQIFYAKDIRRHYRLHPMKLKRYLDELEGRSYIRCRNKSQKTGHEYEVTVWDDYENLKRGINILDTILEKLKTEEKKQEMVTA